MVGPNLLSPTAAVGTAPGLPGLAGPYLIAGTAFAVAAITLGAGARRAVRPAAVLAATTHAGLTSIHRSGIAVLAIADVVMVAVMTMAPLQLDRDGSSLAIIGLVVSIHIAGMYAPSPASAWIASRIGAARAALAATATLALACVLAAVAADHQALLGVAMAAVGLGWNLALISGSLLLTSTIPTEARPRREGWSEAVMGRAAAGGGGASGLIMTSYGYPTLAGTAAIISGTLIPLVARRRTRLIQ